jgi:outer membrane protein assembly factor BamA
VTFDVGFTVNRMGKPALDCHFAIPRILGTVASLSADASVSSMIAHSFDIRYALPGLFAGNWKLVVEAVKQVNDYHYASSFSEGVSGIGMGLIKGNHRIGLDAHLRDIYPLVTLQGSKLVASEEIRRMPLRSVKTSLSYNWIVDRTIGNPHAVGGYKFVLNCESSGVFGDVRMTKLTSMFQFNRQLFRSITLHTRLASGAISQFGSGKTPIQDRFFLGGTADETSTFRGFGMRSMGPSGKRVPTVSMDAIKSEKLNDHLGGDAFVSIDNVVSFPIVNLDGIDIRGMAFVQAGALLPHLPTNDVLSGLASCTRVTAGVGVRVPLGPAGTVELTLCKPLYGNRTSDTLQMLQIGLRLSNMP